MSEQSCLFCKIIKSEIPGDFAHKDDRCVVIRDINPQAPVHVLLIPKKEIDRVGNAKVEDQALLGHMMLTAGKIARQLGVGDDFRLVVNNGAGAGQTVFHLHLHILGGRKLRCPPG